MNHRAPKRGASKRNAPRGGSPRSGKRATPSAKRPEAASKAAASTAPAPPLPPLRLGFVRGVAPSKWAERWVRAVREQQLELVPVALADVDAARSEVDVLLERAAPGATPPGADQASRTRHALRLYEESVALVVAADHELAERAEVDLEDLALLPLLDHPDHHEEWPAAQRWRDPAWAPLDAEGTLELVATGMGGALMSLPLARHVGRKRIHAVIPVTHEGRALLPGTEVWATWSVERDADDVQRLMGVLRGRTARSSR